jgi:predicted flap endonuclease-1-like 5' DNA nuclease
VVHPFVFSISQYPFYRIEGHTGMKVDDAVASIKNLRRRYALSFDIIMVTTDNLKELFGQPFNEKEFAAYGLEHVCGVQKGYTLLLLHDGDKTNPGVVIADFQIPFMAMSKMNDNVSPPPPPPPPPPPTPPVQDNERIREQWNKISERIGALKEKPDTLQNIRGLNAEIEKGFNETGINSYLQLSKLTEKDIQVLAAMINVDEKVIDAKWFVRAAELAKESERPSIREKIGKPNGKDDLKKIKGIDEGIETELNKVGILTYKQLSLLTRNDIESLAKEMGRSPNAVKKEWFTEAKKLEKAK